jgi:hypothetical protein
MPDEIRTISAGPVAAAPPSPYKWGNFQGWVSLIVGSFALLISPVLIRSEIGLGFVISSPLLIASGYAFALRKRYAVWMPYVWMVFCAVNALGSAIILANQNGFFTSPQHSEEITKPVAQLGLQLLFWTACALYYRKRKAEFR